jgi:hypothetical protein
MHEIVDAIRKIQRNARELAAHSASTSPAQARA